MLSVNIWCDHFILLLPDIRSSHFQPHGVNTTHYSSFLRGGFCNMCKQEKGGYRSDATAYQISMDTCSNLATMVFVCRHGYVCFSSQDDDGETERIIVMSVCFMFSGKCRMLKLKLCPFYCQLFMHHCNYHDNCHICSSRWCGTFRQEGQSETGSVWSVTRVFSAFHVWRTKILNAVSTHFCPIMQQCKMDLKGDVIAIM